MNEYRVKGLSCGGCAMRMEQEIRELDHGDHAKLSYNSGKLTVHPDVSLTEIKRILKSDGAYIIHNPNHEHHNEHGHNHGDHERHDGHSHSHGDHGHDHHHEGGLGALKPVIGGVILYAVALLGGERFPGILSVILYLAAMGISGYVTFIRGLRNIIRFKFTMDTLMTVALIGAVAIGEWKEATLVAILFGLNEWLEGLGMEKARRSMEALLQVAPKEAIRINDDREMVVPIHELVKGDWVKIRPGDQIPSDGTVVEGASSVSEAAITGESLPIEKETGDTVFGGSINHAGLLKVRVDKAYEDSSLAKILHLVQEAQETKTPTELFINRFAKYYTPAIMMIALLVTVAPPLLFGKEWLASLYQGLSVLIVGCPCALILASPIAIVSGIARTARHGILVKGGVHLESLGKIDTIAFDKTGTLTKGKPHVAQWKAYGSKTRMFGVAAAIERTSSHPLAKAIVEEAQRQGAADYGQAEQVSNRAGAGIEASIDGVRYRLGNEKSLPSSLHLSSPVQDDLNGMKDSGLTIVVLTNEENVLGLFGIQDEIRQESPAVIAELSKLGIKKTVMLTGDHKATAEKVASAVGLSDFRSSLMPEDKVSAIKQLSAGGHAAMVGDGVNDAPALAAANLGIAMGKGTDSALETADIVLMQDHLGKLPLAVRIARRVNRVIRLNIGIALGLKLIALLLTIPGWLTLWIAVLSDMGATLLVTLIGLTLFIEGRSPESKADQTNGAVPKG